MSASPGGLTERMRAFSTEVRATGWGHLPLPADDPFAAELRTTRRRLAELFRELVESGVLAGRQTTASGQDGFTEGADEGEVGLVEWRSHYVFNQALPQTHPLRRYSPYFYGAPAAHEADVMPLADLAVRLHELLDLATLTCLESLEQNLGLPFGQLAGPVALGERLMRIQWYPQAFGGRLTRFVAATKMGEIPIWGHERQGRRIVRASPHSDTGCWTWQVFASDDRLRFWDRSHSRVVSVESGDQVMYGNVCDFLALDQPELHSPLHWVDADDTTAGRISISYFAHHRPGVLVRGRPAGAQLYKRLAELGYVTADKVNAVELLFQEDTHADRVVVREALAWEAEQSNCEGFTVPLSRYYAISGDETQQLR